MFDRRPLYWKFIPFFFGVGLVSTRIGAWIAATITILCAGWLAGERVLVGLTDLRADNPRATAVVALVGFLVVVLDLATL